MKKYIFLAIIFLLNSCSTSTIDFTKNLNRAKEAFDAQNYKQAIYQLDEILSTDANHSEALLLKGRTLALLGKEKEAINIISQAIKSNANFHEAYSHRSILYSQKKDFEKAKTDIIKAIEIAPQNINYQTELGVILYRLKNNTEAINQFSKVIASDAKNENSFFFRGQTYLRQKAYQQAIDDFDSAIEINHTVPNFHSQRGFASLEINNYKEAIEAFTKTIALTDTEELSKSQAIAFNNRGYAKYKNNELGKALNDIDYSLQLFEDNAYAYRNRALVFIQQNRIDVACQAIGQALKLGYTKQYGEDLEKLKKLHCK